MIRALSASVLALAIVGPLAACAGEPDPPAWFQSRRAELNRQGSPTLNDIPRGTDATTDPAHWDAVAAELAAAEAAMKAHPRSQTPPPDPNTPADFEDKARQDIDQTRGNY